LRRDRIFVSVILLLTILLLILPDIYISPYAREELRCSGMVSEVDNLHLHQHGLVITGSQGLTVRLLEGPYTGKTVKAGNTLLGKMETDKVFQKGDRVFLVLSVLGDQLVGAVAYDHYRLGIEGLLLVLFAALLIGFAGWAGVKALLSFFFALLLIWKLLLPTILLGFDPIWMALAIVSLISAIILFLAAGLSCKALVAWLGAQLGILLTAAMAFLLFPPFRLHGAIQPFSETLLYSGFDQLNLGRLFIAAVFLGASGAVIDLAIDVSAAMHEVFEKRPDLSSMALIKSGMVVGRPMATTMVTTLLMAYVSGYLALLLILFSKGIPAIQILNINYVAAEILKTVVGSFGIITVAPFTALVGGLIMVKGGTAQDKP
jgi:uncharacterized membrane protein